MLSAFLQVGLSLLLWLQVPRVLALKGDSGCNKYMCLNATLNNDETITYELTGLREPLGWLALGWGHKMAGTQMVVVWPSKENGSTIVSPRYGWGHEEPSRLMNPSRHPTPVDPVATSWCPPNSTRMAFKMTVNTTALAEDPIERLIWAYSMTRPDSDSKNAHLQVHYRGGSLRVNFSKEAIPPPPPGASIDMSGHHHGTEDTTIFEGDNGAGVFTDDGVPWGNHEKLIAAHAVLLASGFLILLPGGTLIARWTRTITPKWFKAHSIINMTVSLPIIVIGWLLGPVAVLSHDAPHLNTTHQICGALLLVLYFTQVWLGRYIHRRRAAGLVPGNKPHPPSNILHVCLGISVIALAFFQVRSGFDEWESATNHGPLHAWCHDLWFAWTIIVPAAYLIGMFLLPRQFYQERQHILPGGDINYVVLPDGADSPLLNEVERHDFEVYEASGGEFRNSRVSMDTVKVEAEK